MYQITCQEIFLFVLLLHFELFHKTLESSRDLTNFIMSSISSFDIISVVLLLSDPKIFLCIPTSAIDAAAVNRDGIKTLLANSLITFFINSSPIFINGPRSLPRNPPYCIILYN